MNCLLTLLTAAGFAMALSTDMAGAVPAASGLDRDTNLLSRVQLGGGGPVGGGPNGVDNGTGTGVGNGAFRGGAAGTGTDAVGGGSTGGATADGLRPSGGNQQPNGSKPAPMQSNGVRKVQ